MYTANPGETGDHLVILKSGGGSGQIDDIRD